MPTEPGFDHDYLRRLVREHPTWTRRQLAEACTEHERETDPAHPRVTVQAVTSVIHRKGDTWVEQGDKLTPTRKSPTVRSQPFANLPQKFWWDQKIQNIRALSRISAGEESHMEVAKVRLARNMAAKLYETHQVIDLDPSSKPEPFKPYFRDARLDEIDGEGNLITYTARYPGLTEAQWRELGTPQMREVAAARFIREGEGDTTVAV